jgi:hypothetical protein
VLVLVYFMCIGIEIGQIEVEVDDCIFFFNSILKSSKGIK